MEPQTITSAKNPKIKDLMLLREKSKVRKETGLFVVEGIRETTIALEWGYELSEIFICKDIAEEFTVSQANAHIYEIPRFLYEKISYRGSTEGVVSIFKSKEKKIESIILGKSPLVIVLESVEKPGNLGAVLRTADAVKADAVIVCDSQTDIYNPNVIRSSLGGFFTNQIALCSSSEAYDWLKKNKLTIHTAQLQDSDFYYKANFKEPCAIVMGTESLGLSSYWREKSDSKIRIPMMGSLDSLNVSVSTAILCYEAVRQRKG